MDSFTGIAAFTYSSQVSVMFSAHLGNKYPSLKEKKKKKYSKYLAKMGSVSEIL